MTRAPRLPHLLVALGLGTLLSTAAAQEPTENPHVDPQACLSCHEAAPDAVGVGGGVGEALPITATCRSCHPTADMHPVDIPQGDLSLPDGWPLEDGVVTCYTCHVEPTHGGVEAVPEPYHRDGPYDPVTDLCYACHERSDYARTDPHHPDDPKDDGACSACHQGPVDEGASPAQARLRDAFDQVCSTCHEGQVHLGVEEHLGEVLPDDMASQLDGALPLDPDGAIQCWTCHDVHQQHDADVARRWRGDRPLAQSLTEKSLTEEWRAIAHQQLRWPGSDRGEHPSLLALPARDGSLCKACHGDGP